MTASANPGEVVRAVCDGVSRLVSGRLDHAQREEQLDLLAALYAEHTDVRHPFAIGGDTPLRTRADLRRHFAGSPGRAEDAERFTPVGLQVHHTSDPEVVITEFRYEGSAGGRSFSLPCIFVTRVRDGMIIESRDYSDHIAFARAFGHLGNVAASLTAEERR
jgi:ketosteroid isomerase-like protein